MKNKSLNSFFAVILVITLGVPAGYSDMGPTPTDMLQQMPERPAEAPTATTTTPTAVPTDATASFYGTGGIDETTPSPEDMASTASTSSTSTSTDSTDDSIELMAQAQPYMEKEAAWNIYLGKVTTALSMAHGMRENYRHIASRVPRIVSPLAGLLTAISQTPGNPAAAEGVNMTAEELDDYNDQKTAIVAAYNPARNAANTKLSAAITALEAEKARAESEIENARAAYRAVMNREAPGPVGDAPDEIPSGIRDDLTAAGEQIAIMQAQKDKITALARSLVMRVQMVVMAYRMQGLILTPAQRRVARRAQRLGRFLDNNP